MSSKTQTLNQGRGRGGGQLGRGETGMQSGMLDETADGISGTFTHQVYQKEKKQGISMSQVHKQYKMRVLCFRNIHTHTCTH